MPRPKPLPDPEAAPEEDDPMSVEDEDDEEVSPLLKRNNRKPQRITNERIPRKPGITKEGIR